MVLIDLQKAFDTVQHDIILIKLKALGFSHTSLQWVKSYLVGREQVVDVEGTLSTPLKLTCGVPQGSVLGPLFLQSGKLVDNNKNISTISLVLFGSWAWLKVVTAF